MNPLPFYAHYPKDRLSTTQHLTHEEKGILQDLLDYMWVYSEGCSLPDDNEYISRLLRIKVVEWEKIRNVLVRGPTPLLEIIKEELTAQWLREAFTKAAEKRQQKIDAANKRWGNVNLTDKDMPSAYLDRNDEGGANAMQPHIQMQS